jgi:hypothetical protein
MTPKFTKNSKNLGTSEYRYTPNGVKDDDRVASATVFFTVGSKDGDRVT